MKNLIEELKKQLFMAEHEAISDFIGSDYDEDDKDVIENKIDNVIQITAPQELIKYLKKFGVAEYIYVCGRKFMKKDGKYEFGLIRPSRTEKPYISTDPDNGAMRLCGDNGSALYWVNFDNAELVNMNNPRYGVSFILDDLDYEDRCPKKVALENEQIQHIMDAIMSGDTVLA